VTIFPGMTYLAAAPGSRSLRPLQFWLLAAYTALLGIETGGGLFTTAAVFKVWAGSAAGAIGWDAGNPFYIEEGDFFMFTSPTLGILALATLIAGWRSAPPVRTWLRASTLVFIIVFVWTMAYFVPVQDALKGQAGAKLPVAQLEAMLWNFTWLNYVRQVMLVATFGSALHAFGLAYRVSGKAASA
jgi:hypothetical protein